MMIVLLSALMFLIFNVMNSTETGERVIKGKGMDSAGNVWLIVADCETCDANPVQVNWIQFETYKVGEKYP